MKNKYLLIGLVFLGLVLVSAWLLTGRRAEASPVPVVPQGAHAGDLTGVKQCEYQAPGSNAKYGAECGTLTVPENWDGAGSGLLALPVVRIPARGPNPEEPVFWLAGGPGGSNLSWAAPDWLVEKHDVVLLGYRGVDGTENLACHQVGQVFKTHLGKDLFSEQARMEYVAAVKQCAADYQAAGVDLSGYTVPGVVQDMEAARKALGYDRINLFSESYGTRVAQIYAYLHPDRLSRLVLIGVNTPGHFIFYPAALDKTMERVRDLCAKDAWCSSQTSDLAQTMYAVNHNMPKQWLAFNIDPDTIRLASHVELYSVSNMSTIVDAYLAAAQGDPSALAILNLVLPMMTPADMMVYGDEFSKGGTVDLGRYRGIESISLGNSIMGAPFSELIWPMAKEWPLELISPDLRELQESNVDMLLVNGTVDVGTPSTDMDEARPFYHKAQMVLLPEFSHTGDVTTLQPQAFQRLITSYYDTGVADSSLYVYQPLSFQPQISLTLIAKLLVAAALVLPVLLLLAVVWVLWRVRRRRTVTA